MRHVCLLWQILCSQGRNLCRWQNTVSAVDTLASHIVHVCDLLRHILSPGVFGSVQGLALKEGQAGEFVASFKSSGALDNSQSQCTLASKLIAK